MAGGVWMFLIVAVGMFFCMLSMAEMASMWVLRNIEISCMDLDQLTFSKGAYSRWPIPL